MNQRGMLQQEDVQLCTTVLSGPLTQVSPITASSCGVMKYATKPRRISVSTNPQYVSTYTSIYISPFHTMFILPKKFCPNYNSCRYNITTNTGILYVLNFPEDLNPLCNFEKDIKSLYSQIIVYTVFFGILKVEP